MAGFYRLLRPGVLIGWVPPHPAMDTPIAALLERKGSIVHAVPPTTTVAEAVRLMNRHKIGSVLVLEHGDLLGIFTERDVLARVVVAGLAPAFTLVHEVMTRDVTTLRPDQTLAEAMETLRRRSCRHLPVVEGGQVTGVISIGDVSRWLDDAHRAEAEHLRSYIAGGLAM